MSSVDIRVDDNGCNQGLDTYCYKLDIELQQLLEPIRELDATQIPSPLQREGFEMMRLLIDWAISFAGTLKYDVQATHDDCPEHDKVVQRRIARVRAAVMGEALTDAVKHLVLYNYADELRDYERQEQEGNEFVGHIFEEIEKLSVWINSRDMGIWE